MQQTQRGRELMANELVLGTALVVILLSCIVAGSTKKEDSSE